MSRFDRHLWLAVAMCLAWPVLPAHAQDAPLWGPVLDTSLKAGNKRSLGSLNAMVPITQSRDRMLYGDLRTVLSTEGTWEGNAGAGYRQITSAGGHDVIGGVYGFYDHRITESGNTFYQATIGAEAIGNNWDARVNFYQPFGSRRQLTGNGAVTASLVGTQIFLQDGRTYESSMRGFDLDLGHAVPFTDNRLRAYGGYYKFNGDHGQDDIKGYRTRLVADVTDWFRLGAEYQFEADGGRGDQGFVEARIRIPLQGDRSSRPVLTGLQKRMMEPVVRDIDIVTAQPARAAPVPVSVAGGSGETADIYFVDNTASAGGDGSQARPFNTLAAAQAAAGKYDTIYIARGDGTTTGQNAGVTLGQEGQRLIGSGVALTVDLSKVALPAGIDTAGLNLSAPLRPAGTQAVITNTAGAGVTVGADKIEVAGISVDGATLDGIRAFNVTNTNIHDVSVWRNGNRGIYIQANNRAIGDVALANINGGENTAQGIYVLATGAASIGNVTASNINFQRNILTGMSVVAYDGARVGDVTVRNSSFLNGFQTGLSVASDGVAPGTSSILGNVLLEDIESSFNKSLGFNIAANQDDVMGNVTARRLRGDYNGNISFSAKPVNGNARMGDVLVEDSTFNYNKGRGINIESAAAGSVLGNVTVRNTSISYSNGDGLNVGAFTGSTAGNILFENIDSRYNSGRGLLGYSDGAASASTAGNVVMKNSVSVANSLGNFVAYAGQDDRMGTVTMENLVSVNSGVSGVDVFAVSANAVVGDIVFRNVSSSGSGAHGIVVNLSSSGAMGQVTFTRNSTFLNGANGVYINDDSSNGIAAIDMGGGALGSAGLNRSYLNGLRDLRVDLDGGLLVARNNWWGVPTGLGASRFVVEDASTIDSTNFLTSDPAP